MREREMFKNFLADYIARKQGFDARQPRNTTAHKALTTEDIRKLMSGNVKMGTPIEL